MKLIYRAQIFSYQPAPAQPYRKPRALNWRFQAPGETYGEVQTLSETRCDYLYNPPRALNWRFQMAGRISP
jgi:hypothetical protein